jgi:hypothetical protein
MHNFNANGFKSAAAVLTAVFVVVAFTLVGFSVVTAKIMFGSDVAFPSDWLAAMLSLSSMFAGYLVGRSTSLPITPAAPVDTATILMTTSQPAATTTIAQTSDNPNEQTS